MNKDILLIGACFIFVLLKLRHDNKLAAGIKVMNPDYDRNKIKLIDEEASNRIRMVDLNGRSEKTWSRWGPAATPRRKDFRWNLYDLLKDNTSYNNAYLVVNLEVAEDEVVESALRKHLRNLENKKATPFLETWQSSSWYHFYSHHWTPEQAKNWKTNRHDALVQVLTDFPNLKFIIYRPRHIKWWEKQGFPMDRLIFWPIQFIGTQEEYKERMEEIKAMDGFGFHNFPTEDSYNELYDIVLTDADRGKERQELII